MIRTIIRPVNDNQQDELLVCPCGNLSFILQSTPEDTVRVRCGKCYADCTAALVPKLEVSCQP